MKIFISAGDLSGELYGEKLIREISSRGIDASFFSLGKGILAKAGAKPISSSKPLKTVGISEAFTNVGGFIRLYLDLKKFFEVNPPDLVILIDYPEFNLNLVAPLAKRKGLKVIYFIPPQVWAWREGRVKKLQRLTDALIVVLPFERDYYLSKGVNNVFYFGHPIVDFFPGSRDKVFDHLRIGLFPGSRVSELKHHIPIINEVSWIIKKRYPEVSFMLPVAPGVEEYIKVLSINPFVELLWGKETRSVMEKSHIVLVASGTVTLEAAITRTPMIVFYKVSPLSAFIGKKLIKVPFVSLPNLIEGRKIVAEFIQYFEPYALAWALECMIKDFLKLKDAPFPELGWHAQKKSLEHFKNLLGDFGVTQKIATFIVDFLEKRC